MALTGAERQKRYREKNRDKVNEYRRKYYAEHKEEISKKRKLKRLEQKNQQKEEVEK